MRFDVAGAPTVVRVSVDTTSCTRSEHRFNGGVYVGGHRKSVGPNDPKLSDRRKPVRCSAWLGDVRILEDRDDASIFIHDLVVDDPAPGFFGLLAGKLGANGLI